MLTYKQITQIVEFQKNRRNPEPEDEIITKILLRIQHKIKEQEKPINIPFEKFWDLYAKKVDRPKCERKWRMLKDVERFDIMQHIPLYIKSQPDKMYRKDPYRYLNNRCWEDEIIMPKIEVEMDNQRKTTWI